MTKFAATLTVSGLIGFLLLEALKILLAPVAAWLMGFVALAIKVVLVVLGVGLGLAVLALSFWAYRRYRRSHPTEAEAE
jgi:ABC-type uncharacterized transport system permease subunit